MKNQQISEARKRAISNAMSYNNALTQEYLLNKSVDELLCFVHPLDREDLRRELNQTKN
jgi:hypothetical protein